MKSILRVLGVCCAMGISLGAWASPGFEFLGPKDTTKVDAKKNIERPGVADHLDFNAEGYPNPNSFEEDVVVPLFVDGTPDADNFLASEQDLNQWPEAGPDVFFNGHPFSQEAKQLEMPWMVRHGNFDKNPATDLAVIVWKYKNQDVGGLWVGKNFDGLHASSWAFYSLSCNDLTEIPKGEGTSDIILQAVEGNAEASIVQPRKVVPTWVQVGDTNADGAQDIVVATSCGTINTFINKNDGSGDFNNPLVRKVDPDNHYGSYIPWSFVLDKFDSDQYPDIAMVAWAFGDYKPATIFLKGTSDGGFANAATNPFTWVDKENFECVFILSDIIAAKLNGDDTLDLAVTCPFAIPTVKAVDNPVSDAVVAKATNLSYAKAYQDGVNLKVNPILALPFRKGFVSHAYVYLGKPGGITFGTGDATHEENQLLTDSLTVPISVSAGKFNADDNYDLAIANMVSRDKKNHPNEGYISFHANDGSGHFDDDATATYRKYMGYHPTYGFTADFNEDGRDDYFVSSHNSKPIPVNIAAVPRIPDAVQVLINTNPPGISVPDPSCDQVKEGEVPVTFKITAPDSGGTINTVDVTVTPAVDASKITKGTMPAKDVTVTVSVPVAGEHKITVVATDNSSKQTTKDYTYSGNLADCGPDKGACPDKPITIQAWQRISTSLCLTPDQAGTGNTILWTQIDGPELKIDALGGQGMPAASDNCINFTCDIGQNYNDYTVNMKFDVLGADGNAMYSCPVVVDCKGLILEGSGNQGGSSSRFCSLGLAPSDWGYASSCLIGLLVIPGAALARVRRKLRK